VSSVDGIHVVDAGHGRPLLGDSGNDPRVHVLKVVSALLPVVLLTSLHIRQRHHEDPYRYESLSNHRVRDPLPPVATYGIHR